MNCLGTSVCLLSSIWTIRVDMGHLGKEFPALHVLRVLNHKHGVSGFPSAFYSGPVLVQCNVLGLLQNSWITGGLRILYFTRANQAEESVDRESIRSRRREALTDS